MAAAEIRDRVEVKASNIPGVSKCDISFDATCHGRGHYSNQGFASAIDAVSGKVLDYCLYNRVCKSCSMCARERRNDHPDDYATFWEKHESQCSVNFSGISQGMEGAAAWKFGSGQSQSLNSSILSI